MRFNKSPLATCKVFNIRKTWETIKKMFWAKIKTNNSRP